MRLGLAGTVIRLDPIIVTYTAHDAFSKAAYPGYTNFDVICIGGSGGRGGGCHGTDTENPGVTIRNYGGSGGGGGFHRVQGVLAALDPYTEVSPGARGSDGVDAVPDPDDTTDGTDGEASFFGSFCIASGGNHGQRAISCSRNLSPNSNGGDGGLGGQGEHGWGGVRGIAGSRTFPGAWELGTPGADGTLGPGPIEFTVGFFTMAGLIGRGGGGGAGGIGEEDIGDPGITRLPATFGGKGSWDPADQSVYGPEGAPFTDPDILAVGIGPGPGGGARVTPLNGSPTIYGQAGQPGVVVVCLTVE